jgi:hypothetical protein
MPSVSLRFSDGKEHRVQSHRSLERAIEAAFDLIAGGYEVHGIDRRPPAHPIAAEAIAHIYDIWLRERNLRRIST